MEFRPMRRHGQQLPAAVCREILTRGRTGVLALLGDGDYPYAVPMNYLFRQDKLYFHCARAGHKLDAIRRCPRASFCVVDADRVVSEAYATDYRSVIAFGGIRIMEDPAAIRQAIQWFAEKYSPDRPQAERNREIAESWDALCMLEFSIQSLTGKEGLALSKKRRNAE